MCHVCVCSEIRTRLLRGDLKEKCHSAGRNINGEDDIKKGSQQIGWVDWTDVTQNRKERWAVVKTITNQFDILRTVQSLTLCI